MGERVWYGNLGGGDYGLLVARPGYDLAANPPPKGIAFDSRWGTGSKIVTSGAVNVPTSGGGYLDIFYGETLGYIPRVFAIGRKSGVWSAVGEWDSYADRIGLEGQWDYNGTDWSYQMIIENNRLRVLRGPSGLSDRIVYVVLRN